MATCEVCGDEYDKTFEIRQRGEIHVFDSFECAIHALAPTCEHCGCRIIGHGVESEGRIFSAAEGTEFGADLDGHEGDLAVVLLEPGDPCGKGGEV